SRRRVGRREQGRRPGRRRAGDAEGFRRGEGRAARTRRHRGDGGAREEPGAAAPRAGAAGAGGAVRVLFLDPFHGGSHAAFADGWAKHSRHAFDVVSMPARFWKWRMRGAALHFARKVANPRDYQALVVTDLMSLSDLKALWGADCPPALLYFHENQL